MNIKQIILFIFILPLTSCKYNDNQLADNNAHINNFELVQENPSNDTSIKISSPKAIIDPFIWDLNKSIINFDSPLEINSNSTTISSTDGRYNIDSKTLNLNNIIFNESIFNSKMVKAYNINIKAEKAKWLKSNNSLEFSSKNNQ